jgi:hypothetical protein
MQGDITVRLRARAAWLSNLLLGRRPKNKILKQVGMYAHTGLEAEKEEVEGLFIEFRRVLEEI